MKKILLGLTFALHTMLALAGIADPDQVRIVANNPNVPADGTLTNFFPVPASGQACMFYFDGTARKPRCPRVISGVTWDSVNSTIAFSGSPGATGATGPAGPAGTAGAAGAPGTTDYLALLNVPATFAPAPHTHAATDIADSTATGRAVLTAPTAATARGTLGVQSTSEAAAAYYPASGNPAGYLTTVSSAQITAALGFTPYNATNPAGYITPSALSPYLTSATAASTYATAGALTSGLAGKFNSPTGTTAQYLRGDGTLATFPAIPSAPAAIAQAAATRALNTAFQISATRGALVSYSVQMTVTASIANGQDGDLFLEIASDSGFTANVQVIAVAPCSQVYTLAVALQGVQKCPLNVSGFVPIAYYARLRTANNTGTPAFVYRAGQEVQL